MQIQVMSDLHLEFHPDDGQSVLSEMDSGGVDLLILAGDVTVGGKIPGVLSEICARFPEVLYLFGNHEFYRSSFEAVRVAAEEAAGRLGNLHVLDNSGCTIGGIRFLGTTLWFPHEEENRKYEPYLTDFRLIQDFRRQVYEENERAVRFLESTVRAGDVVVTHHLPSQRSIHERYRDDPLNRFFLCELDDLIRERGPRLWIHGHTHESCDYTFGRTRVLCNPFGYQGHEVNPHFQQKLIIQVGEAELGTPE